MRTRVDCRGPHFEETIADSQLAQHDLSSDFTHLENEREGGECTWTYPEEKDQLLSG